MKYIIFIIIIIILLLYLLLFFLIFKKTNNIKTDIKKDFNNIRIDFNNLHKNLETYIDKTELEKNNLLTISTTIKTLEEKNVEITKFLDFLDKTNSDSQNMITQKLNILEDKLLKL